MTPRLAPRVALAGLAVALLLRRGHLGAALVVGAGLVVLLQLPVLAPAVDRRIADALAALARGATHALSLLVTGTLEVLVVVPVAGLRWFFGVGVAGTAAGESTWQAVPRTSGPARAPFAEPHHDGRGGGRAMAAAVALVAAAALIVLWPGSDGSDDLLAPYDPASSAALADQPDASATLQEIVASTARSELDAFLAYRPTDVDGEHLVIEDGERRSVSSADPEAIEVWFTGGSALFGYGQRDAHTIPSAFARLAAERGIEVRVRNLGVPGYTAYQSALALEAALAEHPAPDLIVSYDGYNDAVLGLARPLIPSPPGTPAHLLLPDLVVGVGGGPAPPLEPIDRDARLDGAVEAHHRGVELSRTLAEAHGARYVATWQPTYFTKTPTPGEERSMRQLGIDAGLEEVWRDLSADLRAQLADDVVDLGDALDGAPPVFYDQVHTGEQGAEIVAAALLDELVRREPAFS